MNRKANWVIITASVVVLIALSLQLLVWVQYTRGTGSIRHARKWNEILAACNSLDDVRKKFNCGRWQAYDAGSVCYIGDPNTYKEGNTWALLYDFPSGEWLAMAYYPSSHVPGRRDNGTVVTRDSAGRIRVFFGHVCGKPHAVGESLEEIYARFDDPKRWKEIFIDE